MAFNNVISASMLAQLLTGEIYIQEELFETLPVYEIKDEYLCDVFSGYTCTADKYGKPRSQISYIDHPAFTALRDLLEREGYIKTQRSWSNGDRVLKEFILNDKSFLEGEQFSCATAMHRKLRKVIPDGEGA
jgi:hypothetical protein